ncbi:MAG: LamG domain-containing protein, partial [Sphingobacteriaceae bacterium]
IGVALFTSTVITSCKKSPVVVIDSLKVGLIAHYQFDKSGSDASGNGNHVTFGSSMTSTANRFGKPHTALYFNGVDSYMSVKDKTELRLNNTNASINLWVRIDGYNSSFGSNLLAKHIAGPDNGWTMGIGGSGGLGLAGNVTFGPGGGSVHARGTQFVSLSEWHMLTALYNNVNRTLSIYIDGVLDNVTENMPSPNAAISSDLYIGRDDPTASVNGYFFKGAMDDVRIYKKLLTSKDIRNLYTLTK